MKHIKCNNQVAQAIHVKRHPRKTSSNDPADCFLFQKQSQMHAQCYPRTTCLHMIHALAPKHMNECISPNDRCHYLKFATAPFRRSPTSTWVFGRSKMHSEMKQAKHACGVLYALPATSVIQAGLKRAAAAALGRDSKSTPCKANASTPKRGLTS